jgi:WD40 repeat protein
MSQSSRPRGIFVSAHGRDAFTERLGITGRSGGVVSLEGNGGCSEGKGRKGASGERCLLPSQGDKRQHPRRLPESFKAVFRFPAAGFRNLPEIGRTSVRDSVRAVTVTPTDSGPRRTSYGGTLRLWDMESGQLLRMLVGHGSWVTAVGITPDGRLAVSGSGDSTLRISDLKSRKELRSFYTRCQNLLLRCCGKRRDDYWRRQLRLSALSRLEQKAVC